jgi:tRNA-modifying protein YgfZ
MPVLGSAPASEPSQEKGPEPARAAVGVWPCADWGTLVVNGPERSTWLEGLVTCQVGKLEPGQGTWGLTLNRQGKIQSVLWVLAASEQLWLALAPGTLGNSEAELGRMLVMEDAELVRPTHPQHWFSLHGPSAAARARALAEQFDGHAAAIDWSGLGGAALVVEQSRAPAVLEVCRAELLSEPDWLRLRLERGLPELGTDFDGRDRPHEAALERRAVNWTKGCYLGQEVVCMQDMRGKVKRSLRLLRIDAPREAELSAGADVVDAARQPIGKLTSSAFSARAGAWLALARVDLEALTRGADAGGLFCGPTGDARWPARPTDPL